MIDLKQPNIAVPPPDGLLANLWRTYKESQVLEGELTLEIKELKLQLERTSNMRQGIERLFFAIDAEKAAENRYSRRSHKPSSVGSTPTPATKF